MYQPIFENAEVFRLEKVIEQIRLEVPDSKFSVKKTWSFFSDVSGDFESSTRSFPIHLKEYKPHENETCDTLSLFA